MEENYDPRIKEYNLGHLPDAETEKFEAEMNADPKLAEAVREQRTVWEISELLAEEQIRAKIRERFAAQPNDPDPKPAFLHKWKYVLFALLTVLGTAGFFFLNNRPNASREHDQNLPVPGVLPEKKPAEMMPSAPAPSKIEPTTKPEVPIAQAREKTDLRGLALAYYRIPDGLSGIRGADNDENLSLATKAFFEKNYVKTLDLLKELPENDQQEALSLRAHAHFGAKHFADAARDFYALEKGGIYRREAQWFGILARLATNPKDKSKLSNSLDEIIKEDKHPYRADAERLKAVLVGSEK